MRRGRSPHGGWFQLGPLYYLRSRRTVPGGWWWAVEISLGQSISQSAGAGPKLQLTWEGKLHATRD